MKKFWEIEDVNENTITPEILFTHRRHLIQKGTLLGLASLLPKMAFATPKFPGKLNTNYKLEKDLVLTKEDLATSYNNFYEFSLDKGEVKPKTEAWKLTDTWPIEVSGLVEKPKSYSVTELCEMAEGIEERIYRFRCVEAWSMVVPWTGFPLAKLIEKLKPKANAKFVKFQTFGDKKIGPNIGSLPTYPWPYTEGLTMAEAMNPLTLITVGMYGKPLPKQNGAPIRLIVPWKYGFKSIKSLVKIEFVEQQPKTLWNDLAPKEYGFYANVNPKVDHPRWSQAKERILDGGFFPKKKPTLLFNGYENEVADLYKGLDLAKNY